MTKLDVIIKDKKDYRLVCFNCDKSVFCFRFSEPVSKLLELGYQGWLKWWNILDDDVHGELRVEE